jgi:hypothetical protein
MLADDVKRAIEQRTADIFAHMVSDVSELLVRRGCLYWACSCAHAMQEFGFESCINAGTAALHELAAMLMACTSWNIAGLTRSLSRRQRCWLLVLCRQCTYGPACLSLNFWSILPMSISRTWLSRWALTGIYLNHLAGCGLIARCLMAFDMNQATARRGSPTTY